MQQSSTSDPEATCWIGGASRPVLYVQGSQGGKQWQHKAHHGSNLIAAPFGLHLWVCLQERVSAAEVRRRFQQDFGVHVWVSPLTSTRIDMSARGLTTVVRSSLHYYNTEGEIERLLEAARQL